MAAPSGSQERINALGDSREDAEDVNGAFRLDDNDHNDEQEQAPNARGTANHVGKTGKGKNKEGYGSSPIASVPLEILAHIFAHLPPSSLGTCQLVCKGWHDVVVDEGSWRTAFETYYGVTPVTLGRRVEPSSWRSEYIARVSLMRRWHRARTPTVIHNPSLGALSYMHIHLPRTSTPPALAPSASSQHGASTDDPAAALTTTPMLSVSLALGAAVHSYPFTGKPPKRVLLASPVDHLDRPMHGLLQVAVTSFACSQDGSRLVWGMRDGSLRFANCAPPGGGRGVAGGSVEQGEVRSLDEAHRPGAAVQLVAFSALGQLGGTAGGAGGRTSATVREAKERPEVFVSAAQDGSLAVWSLTAGAASHAGGIGGERPPPATKLWQARWDAAVDSAPPSRPHPTATGGGEAAAAPDGPPPSLSRRVRATAIAFDSGWLGRHHGRPASVVVGRSDGKIVVYTGLDLSEPGAAATTDEAVVLPAVEADKAVDTLVLDQARPAAGGSGGAATPPSQSSRFVLLAHQTDSASFSRYTFESGSFVRTLFGHPRAEHLGPLTAFAVDFDDPPALPAESHPPTPAEGRIAFPPRLIGGVRNGAGGEKPPLSRSSSVASLSAFQPVSHAAGSRFGRRKYVAAGDRSGRVYLWDWEARQEQEATVGVVAPASQVQDLELEGGASASKVTALEVTEAGLFVGGLDGTLRFYSTLGTSHLVRPPVRTFRDRTAPRHPSRLLQQGLVNELEEERWLVSHIRANRDAVVAAIGGRVLAWRISSGEVKKKGVRGIGGRLSARQERFKANMDLQYQVRESLSALSAESAARLERHQEEHRLTSEFGLPPTLENMTEQEAVAFAMMLSLDEQESQHRAAAAEGAGDVTDGEGWEQAPEDWLGGDELFLDEDLDRQGPGAPSTSRARQVELDDSDGEEANWAASRNGSRSASLSVSPSPYLRGLPSGQSPSPSPRNVSYTWTPLSPTMRALGSPPLSVNPHGKVQVSPRLGPTYGSAGAAAAFHNEPVPDMSPELWPVAAAAPAVGSPPASSPPPLPSVPQSVTASPLIRGLGSVPPSGSAPPSASASGTGTPVRRGWSDVARASVGTGAASPSAGATWSLSASSPPLSSSPSSANPTLAAASRGTPSPSERRGTSGGASLLSERLRQSEVSAREEEEERRRRQEEEDVRYAIELSLAEEASRLVI